LGSDLSKATLGYRPDIDGLRAIAVIPVLFFHVGIPAFSGGFVGVDIFFVISGYVITRRLLEDLSNGTFSIGGFYERRVRRIFPALLFIFALTYLAALFLLLPHEMIDFSDSVAASGVFGSNFYFWKSAGYFDPSSSLRPLLHTWSLAVEEQFYIFMPIALYLGHRYLKSRWDFLFWPVIVISFGLSVILSKSAPGTCFFLLPTRAWELLLGSILILTPPRPASAPVAQILAGAGIALIGYSIFHFDETIPFPGANALYPCVGAALIMYAGSNRTPFVSSVLSMQPLVWIGLISYSLYLAHWPVIVMARYYLIREPAGIEILGVMALTFAIAIFSYHYVEGPFRKPKAKTSQAAVLSFAVASLVITSAIGLAGIFMNGFTGRFPSFHQQEIAGIDQWRVGQCFLRTDQPAEQWSAENCIIGHGHDRLLLWGDSFAAHYIPGLIKNKDSIQNDLIFYTSAGCPPVLNFSSYKIPNCHQFNANAFDLIRKYNIKIVVLSARWDLLARRGEIDLQATINSLLALGVQVFVIGESPEFALDIQSLAYRLRKMDRTSWAIVNYDPTIDEKLRSQSRGAAMIEPLKQLCEKDMCPYRWQADLAYADYGHFSSAGSDYAVKKYFPRVGLPLNAGAR
jgi:peptidoglycan/LPS O-acetylase OafA/YrhL